ncbi:MAG: hypothetical protein R2699_06275 [Acidimicrobiales bacterium]
MTLLRNRAVAASRHPERLVLAAVVLALAGGTYVATGLDAIEALRAFPELPDAGREQLAVIVTMVLLVWIAAPFTTTARRDLTVRKFVLLPIGASPLALGLYVAGLVGVGPLLTVGLIGYTVSAYVYDVVGAVLVASVAACLVLVAVAIGRLIGLALDLLALAPRAAGGDPVGGAGVAGRVRRLRAHAPAASTRRSKPGSARPARRRRRGWRGSRRGGRPKGSSPAPTASSAWRSPPAAACSWCSPSWHGACGRSSPERSSPTTARPTVRARTGSPFDGFAACRQAGSAPWRRARCGCSSARRDGCRGWALFVGAFGLLFSVIAAVNLPEPWAPFAALALTFPLAIHRANEIGADAAGFWMDVVSPGDRGADVLGRDLAALLIDAPLLVGAVAVYTVVWRSWAMAVPALVIVAAGWCITAAVAHVVAVRLATAAGAATDSRRSAGSSTGGMLQPFVAEILAIVGLLPLVVAIVWPAVTADAWLWVAAPAAALYGAAVWFASFRWAAWWTGRHEAELVAMLSTS